MVEAVEAEKFIEVPVEEGIFFFGHVDSLLLECRQLLAKGLVPLDISLCLASDHVENMRDFRRVKLLKIRAVQVVPECDLSPPLAGFLLGSPC